MSAPSRIGIVSVSETRYYWPVSIGIVSVSNFYSGWYGISININIDFLKASIKIGFNPIWHLIQP